MIDEQGIAIEKIVTQTGDNPAGRGNYLRTGWGCKVYPRVRFARMTIDDASIPKLTGEAAFYRHDHFSEID